ncbi:MAG: polymer-forming cytoskeletal protein [Bacteroidales bacterium]
MAKQSENELNTHNIISAGTKFKGEFVSGGNIRIDGNFIGDIKLEGKLIVGPSGTVQGNIVCQVAELDGRVEASIEVKEYLILRSTAIVIGDVVTDKISIEQGATFLGNCKMPIEKLNETEIV